MSVRLARSAGVMTVATLASRVLGLVRDNVLARFFGAGDAMDAFNVASRIPNLVRDLFAEGAMSAAFVPTFTRHLTQHGKAHAWRLGSNVINALIVVTGIIVTLGILFAGPLARLYAEGFANEPDGAAKLALTTDLTQILFPFLLLVAVAVAQAGMLNSLRRFFIPALSPAMYNVAVIASAFLLVPYCPALGLDPIAGIAIGAVVGGLMQIVVQWPSLRAEGFRYRPVLDFKDPGLREVLLLMGPGTIGVAAAQVNLFVNTWLASSQGEGAVSWLNYAFRLMYLPIGLFGVSIATAAIPDIARHAARDAFDDMRRTISSGLRMMLMLSVPATVGLIVLASPIIALILEYGEFSEADTAATAAALMAYAPGLLGYSAVKIASPSFYALRDARTPVTVSLVTIGVNLALNLTLVRVMGFVGLALGTGLAAVINASLLLILLSRRIGGIDGTRVLVAFLKITLASLVMAVVAYAVEGWLADRLTGSWILTRAVPVAAAIGAAVLALLAAARLLRLQELEDALAVVLKRLKRKPPAGA